jgi:hypothetical protein
LGQREVKPNMKATLPLLAYQMLMTTLMITSIICRTIDNVHFRVMQSLMRNMIFIWNDFKSYDLVQNLSI